MSPTCLGGSLGWIGLGGFRLEQTPPLWIAAPRTSLELPRVRALWDHFVGLADELVGR